MILFSLGSVGSVGSVVLHMLKIVLKKKSRQFNLLLKLTLPDISLSQTAMLNTWVRLHSSLVGVVCGTVYFPEFSSLDSLLLRKKGGDD